MRIVFALAFAPALLPGQQILPQVFPGQRFPARQSNVASNCSVDGTVVNAVTGEAIPRAQVALWGPKGQTGVSADNSGHWQFVNASCGQIQVVASRPGFLPANTSQARIGGPAHPLFLADGSSARDVKIALTPQSVVVGHVLDDQGDPVQGAQVFAMASRVVQGQRTFQPTSSGMTNDLGEFRLSALAAGKYIVCAHPSQMFGSMRSDTASGETCYPGPLEGGIASAMPVPAGHESRVDLTLPQVHVVRVTGTVTGMPANQRAGLTLVRRGVSRMGGQATRSAAIQPDGAFEITGVLPGSYTLTTDYFDAGKRLMARVPLEVGSSDVEAVSVHLEPGFSISGSVRYESSAGTVPPNRPISINFRPLDPTMGGGTIHFDKTFTTFTSADFPPGSYMLDFNAPPPFYLKSAMVGGHDISKEPVQLSQSIGSIDVVLSDDSGKIEGQVSGADEQPAAAAVMIMNGSRPPRTILTGATGQFSLGGLAPGDYQIYAWDDTQHVEYANPDWLRHYAATSVTVQPGQNATVKLTRAIVPE